MADTLEGMAWANIIRIQSENDRQFARYVLAARSEFLTLALRKEAAIRKIYLDAADRVAEELRSVLPTTPGMKLRARHLQALEKSLRSEAERIRAALEAQVKDGVKRAVELGADPLIKQLGRCLEDAGVKFSWLKLQRGFGDVNRHAVETFWARTRGGIFLSDRIWLESEKARRAIADVVQDGIARGLDAVKVAKQVEQYLKVRTPVTEFRQMMKRMGPGRIPKNLTYEALRMARTEIAIAHMEGLYAAGRVTPGYLGVIWCLSAAHPLRDECDDLASADLYGMGPGVYPAGEEPIIPHPNCICFVVPKMEPTDKFVGRLRQWVTQPGNDAALDAWYNNIYGSLLGQAVASALSTTTTVAAAAPAATVLKPSPPPPSQPAPPPTRPLGTKANPIKVQNVVVQGGGVSDTWRGTVNGKEYIFKSDQAIGVLKMRRSNLEAELLAAKMFNHVGIDAPKANYAYFDLGGTVAPLCQIEFVSNTQDAWAAYDALRRGQWTPAQVERFIRMQVVDVLIGNGDRHMNNILFDAQWNCIPIDHNLAFATDKVIAPGVTWQKCFLPTLNPPGLEQTAYHILRRSDIGTWLVKSPGAKARYLQAADEIKRLITANDIEQWVDALPDDLAEPARKQELKDILQWRLEHLLELIDSAW